MEGFAEKNIYNADDFMVELLAVYSVMFYHILRTVDL